jgi:4-oxalocrotonate tautomerase
MAVATDFVAYYIFCSNSSRERISAVPVITVAIHPISQDEKTQLIRKLTDVAVEITKVPADKYVVFIDEHENGSIGLGGKTRAEIVAKASS